MFGASVCSGDPDSDEEIEHEIDQYLGNPITVKPELTSEAEVIDRLLALRHRKSSGSDGVTNTTLRGFRFLVDLFNACFQFAYFPLKWCKAMGFDNPEAG